MCSGSPSGAKSNRMRPWQRTVTVVAKVMALDKPNYGIHGSNAPETVGYARSHGCVRLTNWDARWLADRTPTGVTVEFR